MVPSAGVVGTGAGDPWQREVDRREQQLALRTTRRIVPLGRGPEPGLGWRPGKEHWLRCVMCGYLLHFDGETYDTCWCGALHCDPGYARVGSRLGDEWIEHVRLEPM